MKFLCSFILVTLLFGGATNLYSQEKEILIMGTMHDIPKIVKNSYKPLLRRAIKYNPDVIFVESPQPHDTLSWESLKDGWSSVYKEFYYLSDSLRANLNFEEEVLNTLLEKDFGDLNKQDLSIIINSFGYLRDVANHRVYQYIEKYGIQGSKEPLRHENGDLTAKLALKLNIKKLKSMDDQQGSAEYHKAWSAWAKEEIAREDVKSFNKISKKDFNRGIIPSAFGRMGMYTNSKKSTERAHLLNSFSGVKIKTENSLMAEKQWDERNMRMAMNIGNQVVKGDAKKNIVIVGSGHVVALEKELKKNFPDIKVILLRD